MKLTLFTVLVFAATIMSLDALPDQLRWLTIDDALTSAAQENKKIVLDVYTDWCGWCKRMDRDVYANQEVAAYMNEKFIAAKMNPEKSGKLSFQGSEYSLGQFGQALGIRGYPATVFFNEKGEVLTVVAGYLNANDFMKILTYFGDDHYLTMTWEDYSRK